MTQPVSQYLLVYHIWMLLLLQIIFSEVLVLMLLYSIVGHLCGCFSCFRRLFQQVQDSAYNLTFKLLFIVVFFGMVQNNKLFRMSNVKFGLFQKVQRKVIFFAYVIRKMKRHRNLSKNCSIHSKSREISGQYNF